MKRGEAVSGEKELSEDELVIVTFESKHAAFKTWCSTSDRDIAKSRQANAQTIGRMDGYKKDDGLRSE